ncbi:MAG: CPBP family intramembrane metalloprotease [Phaeodactylibacter sp.]|nr:CPBP family intramembrane metalloprotease [Phaeodactylibacter sp.]
MSFFEAARKGDNAPFKYVIAIIAVIIGAFIGQVPLGILISVKVGEEAGGFEKLEKFQETMDFSVLGLDPNLGLFLILLSFVSALAVLFLCITVLHGKKATDVLTGRNRLDWGRVGFAFVFWFGLSAVMEVAAYFIDPGNYSWQFEPSSFFPLLLIALLMLPLQTTFEEALFRGYLMQGFGLLFRNRWLPLLLTSAGFGLLHFANREVGQFGFALMMGYYIGFGLLMGLLTLMDEGTELALGLHAATNIYGAAIVNFEASSLQTPSLFRVQELDAGLMLAVAMASGLLFLFVAARRYRWEDWGKLFRRIEFQDVAGHSEQP